MTMNSDISKLVDCTFNIELPMRDEKYIDDGSSMFAFNDSNVCKISVCYYDDDYWPIELKNKIKLIQNCFLKEHIHKLEKWADYYTVRIPFKHYFLYLPTNLEHLLTWAHNECYRVVHVIFHDLKMQIDLNSHELMRCISSDICKKIRVKNLKNVLV